jgi:SAM-dependent methyltransferase
MDYSFESIKAALALTARYQAKPQFLVADGVRVPFAARCFDKIVAADFFEHVTLADKDAILKEMMRVLKDTGSAIIFTPNGIREKLGEFYWKGRHILSGDKIPKTDLHFGLTTRSEFGRLLHNNGFSFRLYFHDVTRPYLARIPGMRRILALNLLWVIRKKELKTLKGNPYEIAAHYF